MDRTGKQSPDTILLVEKQIPVEKFQNETFAVSQKMIKRITFFVFNRWCGCLVPGGHHELAELGLDDSPGQQLSDLTMVVRFINLFWNKV